MVESSFTAPRPAVSVVCTKCQKETTVPFTPTPGRPIYCRDCFAKRGPPAAGGRGPGGFNSAPRPRAEPRKRMLAQGRKGHFVHDMRAVLAREDTVDENQQRMFIEMVFTRGSRQSTEAAIEFIDEKVADKTVTTEEAERMVRLVEKYSFYR